jgi:outer membrane protein assembly factor BamB
VTSAAHAYDDSDSVLELSPSLRLLNYFAPSSWASNNAQDLDLSTAPALLADGQVVAGGKTRSAYLLDASDLGGIGGQKAVLVDTCTQDIDGGVAVEGTTVFLPCLSGTVAVQAATSPPRLHLLWSASSGGGPPIVAAGRIWSIGQNGILYGLNPSTGTVEQQADVGASANHFPTPSIGDGLLLAPGAERVVAFSASSTVPTPTTSSTAAPTTTSSHAASAIHPTAAGGPSAGVLAVIVLAAVAVLAGLVWLYRRTRRPRSTGG